MGKKQLIEEFDITVMEEQSAELLELRFINKDNATFTKTKGGFVALDYNGVHYDRVNIYRTFPFTDPEHYISIREANDKAKEIGMVVDLWKDLSKEEALILVEQMELRYFTPKIKKIEDIKEEYGFAYFTVQTNMGQCKFTIHMNGGSVITLSETRLLLVDLDGNRYEIPDTNKLSAGEMKKLDVII